jgi:hypothetical protein
LDLGTKQPNWTFLTFWQSLALLLEIFLNQRSYGHKQGKLSNFSFERFCVSWAYPQKQAMALA